MAGFKLKQPLVDVVLFRTLSEGHQPLVVLDVRSAEEFAAGSVVCAINVPAGQLGARAEEFSNEA